MDTLLFKKMCFHHLVLHLRYIDKLIFCRGGGGCSPFPAEGVPDGSVEQDGDVPARRGGELRGGSGGGEMRRAGERSQRSLSPEAPNLQHASTPPRLHASAHATCFPGSTPERSFFFLLIAQSMRWLCASAMVFLALCQPVHRSEESDTIEQKSLSPESYLRKSFHWLLTEYEKVLIGSLESMRECSFAA